MGTKLTTAYDQPALGGVYKLAALRRPGGDWKDTIKLSEQAVKINTPGLLQVRRFRLNDQFIADMIYDERDEASASSVLVDPIDATRRHTIPPAAEHGPLLEPIFRGGRCVYDPTPLPQARDRTRQQLAALHPGIKRFLNPYDYPVGLEKTLHDRKTRLILEARRVTES